ncbi:MAG: recombination protein RecR [Kiritimatiellae bacterium]|nr:recombination protein RecR [Kiritimatiellia bacterium]
MESPLENLMRALSRLPGFGRRSAERAALALVRDPEGALDALQRALADAREQVCCCDVCGGFTVRDANPCAICSDGLRDSSTICVVEEPGDILAFERAGVFRGLYHSLNGKVSASRGTSPADVRLHALVERVRAGGVREIILATATDMEGDATAAFVRELLADVPDLRISRLAFGLPVDSGIGYSDPVTLRRALSGRIAENATIP